MQRQHIDIALRKTGFGERLADEQRALRNREFCHIVATANGQPLAYVHLGKIHLRCDVVDDGTCQIELCRLLNALKPRR
jgi:hypothetical protein